MPFFEGPVQEKLDLNRWRFSRSSAPTKKRWFPVRSHTSSYVAAFDKLEPRQRKKPAVFYGFRRNFKTLPIEVLGAMTPQRRLLLVGIQLVFDKKFEPLRVFMCVMLPQYTWRGSIPVSLKVISHTTMPIRPAPATAPRKKRIETRNPLLAFGGIGGTFLGVNWAFLGDNERKGPHVPRRVGCPGNGVLNCGRTHKPWACPSGRICNRG